MGQIKKGGAFSVRISRFFLGYQKCWVFRRFQKLERENGKTEIREFVRVSEFYFYLKMNSFVFSCSDLDNQGKNPTKKKKLNDQVNISKKIEIEN